MTPEELTVRRVSIDLPGGRILRVERWGEDIALGVVWPETPAAAAEQVRFPTSALGELVEALRALDGV